MTWEKLGRIVQLDTSGNRGTTHTQAPTALSMGETIRVYFTSRNHEGKSFPGFADVDRDNPRKVLHLEEGPILKSGELGMFDEDGVFPTCVLKVGEQYWMYYNGWSRTRSVPYHIAVGLAVSDDGVLFRRPFAGPVVERNPQEPSMCISPWVIRSTSGWQMWYGSGTGWINIDGRHEPLYTIKYAESNDGVSWTRRNTTCIHPRHNEEACTRPTVIVEDGTYHMWFCHRESRDFRDGAGSYRIGYARSKDGVEWVRMDHEAGIDVGPTGWDSSMICYPSVVDAGEERFMFFNGNSFGQTGFGCAVWRRS